MPAVARFRKDPGARQLPDLEASCSLEMNKFPNLGQDPAQRQGLGEEGRKEATKYHSATADAS